MARPVVVRVHPQRHLGCALALGQFHCGLQKPYREPISGVAVFHRDGDFGDGGGEVRVAVVRRLPVPQPHATCRHVELVECDDAAFALRVPLAHIRLGAFALAVANVAFLVAKDVGEVI